jgi:hypothetical protein
MQFLAGTPEIGVPPKGIRVRVNRHGLPVIIPRNLRVLLGTVGESVIVTRVVLTCLSIFRVFPTNVKPDLASIIEPFSGLSRTIVIDRVVKKFVGHFKISFGKVTGFISESAGPISKRATWGSGVDAIALLLYPKVASSIVTILFRQKAYLYLASLVSLWIVLGPLYLLSYMIGVQSRNPIGRLSVVYDQAGKARIIAITNWWIQLSLIGLHKSIFRFLESVPEDGTHNQLAPLEKLRGNNNGSKFSCFDLSSATDRLPIDLQVDILNSLGIDGNLWKQLLNIPWSYKGKDYHYSVGQPMGAYSSWAMLALTHHVIVKAAALNAGIANFCDYAVLGDDIVIKNDIVAKEYLVIMNILGVKINLSKTISSSDVLEFAKRILTPTDDLSPIGPGAILAVMRKPALLGALFHELTSKSVVTASETVRELCSTLPFKNSEAVYMALWTCFGVNGLLSQNRIKPMSGAAYQLEAKTLSWITYGRSIDPFTFQYSLHNGIRTAVIQRARRAILAAESAERRFYSSFWRLTATKGLSNGIYESLALFLSPGFWLYLESVIRQTVHSKSLEMDLHAIPSTHEGTYRLLEASVNVGLDLRWSKTAGKELNSFIRDATKEIWRTYDEMMIIHGADGPNIY